MENFIIDPGSIVYVDEKPIPASRRTFVSIVGLKVSSVEPVLSISCLLRIY